ncbi:MAG: glycosyltransferase family 39 protein [Anaerolineae bacterium]|nr:glycosyltransferase family 39 protein [Anaerolineae bacterium]
MAGFEKKWPVVFLAFLAFAWAIIASAWLFPFYSNNHDEPVYILQAQTLLAGRLTLPVNEFFDDFFTPWFVVEHGDRGIFKYTPVHAAFLALGQLLFGTMRTTLGFVAAGNVILLYRLSQEMGGNRRTALLAAFFFILSPFFLIQSATYLSYTTALLLYLCFAVFFLRGSRRQAPFLLICAGLALGLAFFSRPYDAILFAIPFGLFLLKLTWSKPNGLVKQIAWLMAGLLPILGLVLLYNLFITGHPLRFPFTLYDPLDTFGFGYKRQHPLNIPILYNVSAALDSLSANLFQLNFWVFGGPLLLGLALFQVIANYRSWSNALLPLLFFVFPLGHFFFWGAYNFTLWGVIEYLGPMYYLPVLIPLVLLGAQGLCRLFNRASFVAIIFLLVMGGINAALLARHIGQNYAYTRKHQAIYHPFLEQPLDQALVFVPPLYGPYLLHPLAWLANTPSLDGPILYALDTNQNSHLTLLDAYPDRVTYRFIYPGAYTESPQDDVATSLVEMERHQSNHLTQSLHFANPSSAPYVYTYLQHGPQTQKYLLDDHSRQGKTYEVTWHIQPHQIWLQGDYQKQLSRLDSLSGKEFLVLAASFRHDPQNGPETILEHRYQFRLTGDQQQEVLLPSKTSNFIRGDAFTQSLSVTNPTDSPYVYAYIWNNGQAEVYLLDDASSQGREYSLKWTITPDDISFQGASKQKTASIKKMSTNQFLAVVAAFRPSLSRPNRHIVERRFTFRVTPDNQLEVLLPPEEWYNPNWPEAEWQQGDIDDVMTDR